jgi:hypothetical protein
VADTTPEGITMPMSFYKIPDVVIEPDGLAHMEFSPHAISKIDRLVVHVRFINEFTEWVIVDHVRCFGIVDGAHQLFCVNAPYTQEKGIALHHLEAVLKGFEVDPSRRMRFDLKNFLAAPITLSIVVETR